MFYSIIVYCALVDLVCNTLYTQSWWDSSQSTDTYICITLLLANKMYSILFYLPPVDLYLNANIIECYHHIHEGGPDITFDPFTH